VTQNLHSGYAHHWPWLEARSWRVLFSHSQLEIEYPRHTADRILDLVVLDEAGMRGAPAEARP
jgi:hypothetical protein